MDAKRDEYIKQLTRRLESRIEGGDDQPTLRDYLAMAALAAIIDNDEKFNYDADATAAYHYSDAMLKARKK